MRSLITYINYFIKATMENQSVWPAARSIKELILFETEELNRVF
jgi:hypothetical protein